MDHRSDHDDIARPGRPLPDQPDRGDQAPAPRSIAVVRRRDDEGITTAEYAMGTAAGAGLAALLYKLLTGGFGDQLLKKLFDHVLGLLGLG